MRCDNFQQGVAEFMEIQQQFRSFRIVILEVTIWEMAPALAVIQCSH